MILAGVAAIIALIYFGSRRIAQFVSDDGSSLNRVVGKAEALSDEPVLDFWINEAAGEILAVNRDGQIILARDGGDKIMSEQKIKSVGRILPSPNGRQIVVSFGNPSRPQFSLYSATTRLWRPLPLEVINLSWMTADGGDKIIAFVERPPYVSLEIINPLAENFGRETIINDLALEGFDLKWLEPNTLLLHDRPSALHSGAAVLALNLSGFELKPLIGPAAGLIVKWNPDNSWALKFSSPDALTIIDKEGGESGRVNFVTLPDKCALVSAAMYCFVPKNFHGGVQLPDDYLKKGFYSQDELYKTKVPGGETERLQQEEDMEIDAYQPKFFRNQIIFINRYDQKLYSLTLR